MRKCVFLLLASLLSPVACGPTAEPPPDVPVQPLVIGTSPPMPIATLPEQPVRDEPAASPSTSTPLAVAARDPRLARPARPRALVVTEVQQLSQLFGATPANAPNRPTIARRIAEDYAELARTADAALAKAARTQAVKHYETFANQAPNDPQVDEAYYYSGIEYELLGEVKEARKSYYQLIQRAPNSKFIPFAYFAFGELFFVEAAADPTKDDLAEAAFKEVLKYPPPNNALYNEAKQRLAAIAARRGGAVTRP